MKTTESGTWQVVATGSEFLALKDEWEQLFDQNPSHRPFQAWGWVAAWLRHLAGGHELRIICLRDSRERLLYVLPLILGTAGGRYATPRYLSACGYGAECSDHLSCLRHPCIEPDIARFTATALDLYCGDPGRTELMNLDGDGDFPGRLRAIIAHQGRVVRLTKQAVCPAVVLAATWDDYLLKLSSNFRSQVRRHHKRIANHDSVRFHSIDASAAAEFTRDLVRLNRTRMEAKGEISSLEEESFREFLYDAVPYMAGKGLAWMDVVEGGEDTLGAALNFVHGDTVYYYMGGFAEDAGNLRPGTALFAHVIKRSIEKGIHRYDFLRGAEQYKYRWGAADAFSYRLTVYPDRLFTGRCARYLDECLDFGRMLIHRVRSIGKD